MNGCSGGDVDATYEPEIYDLTTPGTFEATFMWFTICWMGTGLVPTTGTPI